MLEWILNNKEWLFGGIGVSILSFFIHMVLKRKNNPKVKMTQTNTWGATGTQIGIQNNHGDKKDV